MVTESSFVCIPGHARPPWQIFSQQLEAIAEMDLKEGPASQSSTILASSVYQVVQSNLGESTYVCDLLTLSKPEADRKVSSIYSLSIEIPDFV